MKVGDTPVDIEEGLRAGVWTIGVARTGNMIGLSAEDFAALASAEQAAPAGQCADRADRSRCARSNRRGRRLRSRTRRDRGTHPPRRASVAGGVPPADHGLGGEEAATRKPCQPLRSNRQGDRMPFYIRKSVSVGPFRFNLSKSGIGLSAGVKGFRVGTGSRGNYVHMGRYGLYYRASLNGPRRLDLLEQRIAPSAPSSEALAEVETGQVLEMADTDAKDVDLAK